jgi:uncharacterized protein (TIRG00374 family)
MQHKPIQSSVSWLKGFNPKTIVGFLISGILLWLLIHNSGLQLEQIQLGGNQWLYFIGAISVFVFSFTLYALRAHLIWKSKDCPTRSVFAYNSLVIGNFYNCILPGNLGEGMRAWHFSRKNNETFARSLAGSITEKWLDAQVFAVLVVLLFGLKPFPLDYVTYALVYTAGAVVGLTALHLVFLYSRKTEKLIWHLVMRVGKPGRYLYRLYIHTNTHLRNMWQLGNSIRFVVFFILIFFLNTLQFYLLMKAAGVPFPLTGAYTAYLIALSMMVIAFIPSAPGSIGVLHYGVYAVLLLAAKQYGLVPTSTDLQHFAVFAIYTHLSFLLPEIILGIAVVFIERKLMF